MNRYFERPVLQDAFGVPGIDFVPSMNESSKKHSSLDFGNKIVDFDPSVFDNSRSGLNQIVPKLAEKLEEKGIPYVLKSFIFMVPEHQLANFHSCFVEILKPYLEDLHKKYSTDKINY